MAKRVRIVAASLKIVLISALFGIAACQEATKDFDTDRQLKNLQAEIDALLKSAGKTVEGITPDTTDLQRSTSEEINKIFVIEYKVVELSASASANEIEKVLNELGSQRWECFDTATTDTGIRLMLKRPAKTPLRYIPRLF
ncbi:MAG: hypothetical protein K1X83_09420 [Oligoflexia bacterium]|nr:hypothetical protein [Oligoflexia bacterium]